MTLVRFFFGRPSDGGPLPTAGTLRFTPTRERVIEGGPDMIVLPIPFSRAVPKDTGLLDVDLSPSGPGWVWEIYSHSFGVASSYRYVVVPDSPDPVDYTDLVQVDKGTLDPSLDPDPLWWAELVAAKATAAQVMEAQANVEEIADGIDVSLSEVEAARDEAVEAKDISVEASATAKTIAGEAVEQAILPGGAARSALVSVIDGSVNELGVFSANAEGASPDATWQVNRDAIQAANDKAAAAGGGIVHLSPGTYPVRGVLQDSRVTFAFDGVTLVHPQDGTGDVIAARYATQSASAIAGSATLTVQDSSAFTIGQRIAIERAGGILDTQRTVLASSIDDTQTTGITLANATQGWPSLGTLQIGGELISYTARSGATLSGVTRGAFGTTPSPHSVEDEIGLARVHYTYVTDLPTATSVILMHPPAASASETAVRVFAVAPAITGTFTIRGHHHATPVSGVNWSSVSHGRIETMRVEDADSGLMLDQGTADCEIGSLELHNCTNNALGGAALWFFRGCRGSRVGHLKITGNMWVGAYFDDRTTTATPWDGPNNDNAIVRTDIDAKQVEGVAGWPPVYSMIASNRNYIGPGSIKVNGSQVVGIQINGGSSVQITAPNGYKPACEGNEIHGLILDGVAVPWTVESSGNVLHGISFKGATGNPTTATGNLVYASQTTVSGIRELGVEFLDGNPGRPGMRFVDDPDTGIFKWGNGGFAHSHNGVRGLTFLPGYAAIPDTGYNFVLGNGVGAMVGTNATQKLAFWGAGPKVQPLAVANAADETEVMNQLNLLLNRLRSIGIIAT